MIKTYIVVIQNDHDQENYVSRGDLYDWSSPDITKAYSTTIIEDAIVVRNQWQKRGFWAAVREI